MIKVVYAMGDACPIPVIKTKKAIEEMEDQGIVETLVDNEIAVQNICKMAQQMGLEAESSKIDSDEYRVMIKVTEDAKKVTDEAVSANIESCELPAGRRKNVVAVVASDTMGRGDDQLGSVLIKAFIYALSTQDEVPATLIFYNGGVKLACQDSPVLEDLEVLQSLGTKIYACGTCLNYYQLADQLKIGEVTNMYEIVRMQMGADLIIKP